MKKKDDIMEPTFVVRDGMLAEKDYVEWLADVKVRFRQSQIKASIRVNTAMLGESRNGSDRWKYMTQNVNAKGI